MVNRDQGLVVILRVWMDEASLDLEEDSPKLAAQLLKAVRGPHRALRKAELDSIAARVCSTSGAGAPGYSENRLPKKEGKLAAWKIGPHRRR